MLHDRRPAVVSSERAVGLFTNPLSPLERENSVCAGGVLGNTRFLLHEWVSEQCVMYDAKFLPLVGGDAVNLLVGLVHQPSGIYRVIFFTLSSVRSRIFLKMVRMSLHTQRIRPTEDVRTLLMGITLQKLIPIHSI